MEFSPKNRNIYRYVSVYISMPTPLSWNKIGCNIWPALPGIWPAISTQRFQTHLLHGLKARMKNKLIPIHDKMMLHKRYTIEGINDAVEEQG